MSLKKCFAVLATAMLTASSVLANVVVIQPAAIVDSTFTPFEGVPGNLIDQSGLSAPYLTGVTLYEDYILNPPVPTHPSFTSSTAFRTSDELGHIDFSLGRKFDLTNFALWNAPAYFGIGGFDLLVSLDQSFSLPVNVGSFNPADPSTPSAQSFQFKETPGAFVRLLATSDFGRPGINLGEVAFGGTGTGVPEPTTLLLLGLGLAGLGFGRKRLH